MMDGAAQQSEEVDETGVFGKFTRGLTVDAERVKQTFAQFGVLTDDSTVNGRRGFAVIHYASADAVAAALAAKELTIDDVSFTIEPLKPKVIKDPKRVGGGGRGEGSGDDAEPDPCAVYVTPLPENFDEEEVRALFEQFGEVTSLVTRRRQLRDRPAVHAFVNFAEPASAEAAIAASAAGALVMADEKLIVEARKSKKQSRSGRRGGKGRSGNGTGAGGEGGAQAPRERQPRVKKAVYLSNLQKGLTEEQVTAALAPYGAVQSISMRQGDCFATVDFDGEANTDVAVQVSEGTPGIFSFMNMALVVERSKSSRARAADGSPGNGLHVSGFGDECPSEDDMRGMFGSYGNIIAVSIRVPRTFAIVELDSPEAAQAAVDNAAALPLASNDENPLVVELSENGGARRRTRGGRGRRNRDGADAEAEAM